MRPKRVIFLNLNEIALREFREFFLNSGFESYSFFPQSLDDLGSCLLSHSPVDIILLNLNEDCEYGCEWVALIKRSSPESILILMVTPDKFLKLQENFTLKDGVDFFFKESDCASNISLVLQRIFEFHEVKSENQKLWSQVMELSHSKPHSKKVKKINVEKTVPQDDKNAVEYPTLLALKKRYINTVLIKKGKLPHG